MSDQITRSIIVKAGVSRAYQAWENFENFPSFMHNIESVSYIGNNLSRWKMKGPLGKTVEWTAETTRQDLNKRIAWSTKDHANNDVTTSGQVTFNELPDNETEVTVMLQYVPRAGLAGELVNALFAHPEKQLEQDLSNFKSYIEGHYERTG